MMSDEMEDSLNKVSLTDFDEEDDVVIEEDWVDDIQKIKDFCLVGKMLICRPYSLEAMRTTFIKAWSISHTLDVKEVGKRLFLLHPRWKRLRSELIDVPIAKFALGLDTKLALGKWKHRQAKDKRVVVPLSKGLSSQRKRSIHVAKESNSFKKKKGSEKIQDVPIPGLKASCNYPTDLNEPSSLELYGSWGSLYNS
ncbi:hypothetical protein PTKIN_Ptkin13bG0020500 [Pterospermum kingtungense]